MKIIITLTDQSRLFEILDFLRAGEECKIIKDDNIVTPAPPPIINGEVVGVRTHGSPKVVYRATGLPVRVGGGNPMTVLRYFQQFPGTSAKQASVYTGLKPKSIESAIYILRHANAIISESLT